MATITVAGTAIQPAIDKAQPKDTLDIKAGGYAGRLKIGKPLTIICAPDTIIDGGQGDGFINVDIAAADVTWRGGDVRHAGNAFRFRGQNINALVEDVSIPVVDWMVRNTPYDPAKPETKYDDYGGNAFTGAQATGITIRRVKARNLRAVSSDYTRDGGFIDLFEMANVLVESCEVWDSVNFAESGRGANKPLNKNIRFINNTVHGRPNPSVSASATTVSNGMYMRAVEGLLIKGNTFDRIDWWTVLFATGGGFGGPITGEVSDNTFILLPGVNRETTWDAGTVHSGILFDNNRVYADDPNTVIAEGGGKRYYRADRTAFAAATGWEKNAYWGVTPPLDPCAPYKVELASTQAALAKMQAELALANQAVAQQEQIIASVHGMTAPPEV